jgi:chromosome segregation ATPase
LKHKLDEKEQEISFLNSKIELLQAECDEKNQDLAKLKTKMLTSAGTAGGHGAHSLHEALDEERDNQIHELSREVSQMSLRIRGFEQDLEDKEDELRKVVHENEALLNQLITSHR